MMRGIWHLIPIFVLCLCFAASDARSEVRIAPGPVASEYIQHALNTDGHVVFEKGTHVLFGTIQLTGGMTVEGERGAIIRCQDNAFAEVSGHRNRIMDVDIFSSEPDQVQGTAIKFVGGQLTRFWLTRCNVWRFEKGLTDYEQTGKSSLWYIDDSNFYYSKVELKNAFGMCFWNRCAFVITGEWPDVDEDHFVGSMVHISNNAGMNFNDCHCQGNGQIHEDWVAGFRFVNSAAIELNHSMADTIPGYGIAAVNCRYLRLNFAKAGLCARECVWLEDCERMMIVGLQINGRKNRDIEQVPNLRNLRIINSQYDLLGLQSTHGTLEDYIEPSIPVDEPNGP